MKGIWGNIARRYLVINRPQIRHVFPKVREVTCQLVQFPVLHGLRGVTILECGDLEA